jgi:glycerophosphoryl diester phosphodiesterase
MAQTGNVSPQRNWLTQRPIAHRGLHNASKGIIENSKSAFLAAIKAGYAIECDVRLTKDGEAVVFHDKRLEHLTNHTGLISDFLLSELQHVDLKGTHDTLISLIDLLGMTQDQIPLFIELKSDFDHNVSLCEAVAKALHDHDARIAMMSFDPEMMQWFRDHNIKRPLGIVTQTKPYHDDNTTLSATQHHAITTHRYINALQPDFMAWCVDDLTSVTFQALQASYSCPALTWTVRSLSQAQHAFAIADQIIFEGFTP